jgi:hypothetical protein
MELLLRSVIVTLDDVDMCFLEGPMVVAAVVNVAQKFYTGERNKNVRVAGRRKADQHEVASWS